MADKKRLHEILKTKQFKYLSLIILSFGIIFFCSLFQDVHPPKGEYYYSLFLSKNYLTIPTVTIFFIVGLGIGYFWNLNPLLSGLCLFLIFPLTSMIEGTVYRGSHNLIPFEFIVHFIFAIPSIIAVYLGQILFKQVMMRKK